MCYQLMTDGCAELIGMSRPAKAKVLASNAARQGLKLHWEGTTLDPKWDAWSGVRFTPRRGRRGAKPCASKH